MQTEDGETNIIIDIIEIKNKYRDLKELFYKIQVEICSKPFGRFNKNEKKTSNSDVNFHTNFQKVSKYIDYMYYNKVLDTLQYDINNINTI